VTAIPSSTPFIYIHAKFFTIIHQIGNKLKLSSQAEKSVAGASSTIERMPF
jgi:hypothetical protein